MVVEVCNYVNGAT